MIDNILNFENLDQTGYITVQVEGNPAPKFKFYKVRGAL